MPSDLSATSTDNDALVSGSPLVVSDPQQEGNKSEDEQDKMFIYNDAKVHLQRIVSDWDTEVQDTEVRRKMRKLEIDVEGLRQKNELDEDESFIPVRIVDTNIQRELPPYINYLKNSRRISVFECLEDPDQDVDLIEEGFTKVSTYTNWETPHFKCLDGSMSQGWDAVEVVFDEDKPGHFSIEQVGHDKLLFPRSAIDIQQCPRIIRSYDVTILQLQKFVESFGFDPEQVDLIRKTRKNTQKENETVRIYKLYFKSKGIVQVGWFCLTDGVTDWLKKPIQFYCGIDEQQMQMIQQNPLLPPEPVAQWVNRPMNLYPIFILPYRETEEPKIVDHKGRCYLDEAKQEAYTALWSIFVTKSTRANYTFASPSTEDGTGASLKELEDIKLTAGRVLNRPMQFWSPPAPDSTILRILQYADAANSEETNQVNFAAMNREDSRKTAKEIGAAQQQQSLLNSVQLTLFSTFIRQVYSFAWLIVQSQALQNKIKFLQIKNPMVQQLMQAGQQVPPNVPLYLNDIQTIAKQYTIRAAGDVDVIAKQEILGNMQQDWAVIANTPLANQFIVDYIKLKYPDKADTYGAILQQQDQVTQLKGMVGQLGTMLSGLLKDHPDDLHSLPQEQQQTLMQTIQQAQQVAGATPQGQ